MDIQPNNGDTSNRVQMPQKANSSATDTMSRLSVERFCSSHLSSTPNRLPSANTSPLISSGFSTFPALNRPTEAVSATDMATEYATSPTTSSSATTCSSVSTKSPRAWVWRMVIMVEAGAVADASAASTREKFSSSPSTP